MTTSRQEDLNGWMQIKGNPLSKVGVFEYSGAQISPKLDPNKIYNVYRPEEELNDPETIESFKLVPWTDEHEMLGSSRDGLTPAERKGVHGVIGEDVYFEGGYLKGNIKVWSEKLNNLIDNGKKELSIGYRCVYDFTPGDFNGQHYDVVQREIRGNHVALVDEGRSGPDVSVLDAFKFTFDTKGLEMVENKETEMKDEDLSIAGLHTLIKELAAKLEALSGAKTEETPMDEEEKKDDTKEEAKDEEEKKEVKDKEPTNPFAGDKALDKKISRMKAEIIKDVTSSLHIKNELADKLTKFVGVFDHAGMSLDDVAKYGLKKLGVSYHEGEEHATLNGYLQAKKPSVPVTALDRKPVEKTMRKYFNGGAK